MWEEAKPMFRGKIYRYVCVCALPFGIFVVVLCQQLREKEKERDTNENEEEEEEESSDDHHISVTDDIVHHCLLKLDIFRSRHVLGKHIYTDTNRIKKKEG